jgi:hypothetical protein
MAVSNGDVWVGNGVSDGKHIWIASVNNLLTEVSASNGALVRNISSTAFAFHNLSGLAFDGRHIWVASSMGNSVDERSTRQTARWSGSRQPICSCSISRTR